VHIEASQQLSESYLLARSLERFEDDGIPCLIISKNEFKIYLIHFDKYILAV
jgi:hypothetical protein